jgi:hypothetical protein
MRTPILRAMALALTNYAASLLPQSRAKWGEAMRNELEHIPNNLAALSWATGCVVAAFLEGNADRPQGFAKIVKLPSAFLPLAMSLMALAILLVTLAMFGVPHDKDEGSIAHIWQLLMAGQVPLLFFFAVKWLPRAPRATLKMIAVQTVAALAAMAPVYFLHL